MRTILIPGRHHVITRFQAAALNAARERLGGEVLLVWAVTSADHAGTRRNPVAGHRREGDHRARVSGRGLAQRRLPGRRHRSVDAVL